MTSASTAEPSRVGHVPVRTAPLPVPARGAWRTITEAAPRLTDVIVPSRVAAPTSTSGLESAEPLPFTKTTLSRSIAGMIPATRGRIEFDGADITGAPAHVRARRGIALCHEGRRLFREQTVRENLLIAGRHAATGDRFGNLTYAKTARNFNPIMATAARTTVAEVRTTVDMVDPEVVVTPGIFVDRIVEVGA